MAKLNIIYASTTGNTEQIATFIEEGVKAAGVEVEMISVDSADETSIDADFIALGSSAAGAEEIQPEMADFVDSIKDKLDGKWKDGTSKIYLSKVFTDAMTYDLLKDRDPDDEIKGWFDKIASMMN